MTEIGTRLLSLAALAVAGVGATHGSLGRDWDSIGEPFDYGLDRPVGPSSTGSWSMNAPGHRVKGHRTPTVVLLGSDPPARRRWPAGLGLSIVGLSTMVLLAMGCGETAVYEVVEDSYLSLVPADEQFRLDVNGSLPGGVAALRQQGVDRIEVDIADREVVFRLDGVEVDTLGIVDRVEIADDEGSGPLRAKKQVLVLDEPVVLGDFVINDPVIWPGSFEQSPVITIKPRNAGERGPEVSCAAGEACLRLSAWISPEGDYADANNPANAEYSVDTVQIDEQFVNITMDSGEQIVIPALAETATLACGLSERPVWNLPAELGLAIDDPVLIHTVCPSTPGAAIQLIIMDRSVIPVLAPLTEERDGGWCVPSPSCLIFAPT